MKSDQRKNPRFVANDGIVTKIRIGRKSWPGSIHNFSATGFALVFDNDPDITASVGPDTKLTVKFSPGKGIPDISIPAIVANRGLMPDGQRRFGCQIPDLGEQANVYFSFLTSLLSKQGFMASMAK